MKKNPIEASQVLSCPDCGKPVAWGFDRNQCWTLLEVRGVRPPKITDLRHYPARCTSPKYYAQEVS